MLVVGLAPAAHGANRTGRMFTGDSSGDWLYAALHRYGFASRAQSTSRDDGLTLDDCYITAAARCAPPGNKPSRVELERCRPYLAADIRETLKAAGWWATLAPRDRPAFAHGAVTTLPDGVVLVASYHPSRQNTNTGKLTRAMWHGVFERVRRLLPTGRRTRP